MTNKRPRNGTKIVVQAFTNLLYDPLPSQLMGELPSLTTLVRLDLSYSRMSADELAPLATTLHCPKMLWINLGRNFLGDDGAAMVGQMLPRVPALTYLNVAANDIAAKGAKALGQSLHHCPHLTHLDMSYNTIQLHLSDCPRLSYLDVTGNGLRTKDLAAQFRHCPRLGTLILSFNQLGGHYDTEALEKFVEELVSHCPRLSVLRLDRNSLSREMKAVVSKLHPLEDLTVLDVWGEYLSSEGIAAIIAALPNWNKLQELCVSRNEENEPWKALEKELKQLPEFKKLKVMPSLSRY